MWSIKMQEINKLSVVLSRIKKYLQDCESHSMSSANRTSMFWKEIFESRKNFPDLNEMLLFRRGDYAYGIGDDRQGNLLEEENYFRRMEILFKNIVPEKYFVEVEEPIFGSPYFFKMNGVEHSASFVINSGTANRIKHFILKYAGKKKKMSVCEIGAGWGGCAYQLHKILEIENYTIIDLPENLLLSATSLVMSLEERSLHCIQTNGVHKETQSNTINIAIPSVLPNIQAKFDLIINTFSLQEMDFDSVQEYIAWVKNSLNEDGIFVSINAHGKAGVQRLEDYRYDDFHIHHFGVFRKAPVGFFNTIPYEVVLSQKQSSDAYDITQMNTIAEMMQLGLDGNLSNMTNALLNGSTLYKEYLGLIHCFLNESDMIRKQNYLDLAKKAKGEAAVTHYLQANFYFVLKKYKDCIKESNIAIEEGLKDFALFKAKIMQHLCSNVTSIEKKNLAIDFLKTEEELLSVYPELTELLKQKKKSEFAHHISSHIWKSKFLIHKNSRLLKRFSRKISNIYQLVART